MTARRTAKILIERHGSKAVEFAERQVESLASAGLDKGAAEWRGVVAAIRELQKAAPRGAENQKKRRARRTDDA